MKPTITIPTAVTALSLIFAANAGAAEQNGKSMNIRDLPAVQKSIVDQSVRDLPAVQRDLPAVQKDVIGAHGDTSTVEPNINTSVADHNFNR